MLNHHKINIQLLQEISSAYARACVYNVRCTYISSYFEGEEWEIMRGTWFYDGSWIPLETEHSKGIEDVHLKLFQKESNNQSSSKCDTNSSPQSYKGTFLLKLVPPKRFTIHLYNV